MPDEAKLLPCPFCATEKVKLFDGDTVWHPFGDCLLEDEYFDLAKWQSRPPIVTDEVVEPQSLGASPDGDRAATPSEPSQSSVVSGIAGIPSAAHWGDGKTPCYVEFDWACQQEEGERLDEAELYREAEQDEIRCALTLFRSLGRDFGQYRAVKVDGPLNWTITKPRTEAALLAALETDEPPAAIEAAQPIIDRLNRWEKFWTNRYRWAPPDGKRIEVRVGDLRQLRASVGRSGNRQDRETGLGPKDEHAVGSEASETPTPGLPTIDQDGGWIDHLRDDVPEPPQPCPTCGAKHPFDNVFCSDGFHAPPAQPENDQCQD